MAHAVIVSVLGVCFLLVVVVSPFWRKMQISTLWVGKMIAPTGADRELPRGLQDAVTPKYQDTLNWLMPLALLAILILGSVTRWYLGLALFVLALIISAGVNRFYPQDVNTYLRMIIGDLARRMANYKRDGDDLRANAASAVLGKLSQLYEMIGQQDIRVPAMPDAKGMALGGLDIDDSSSEVVDLTRRKVTKEIKKRTKERIENLDCSEPVNIIGKRPMSPDVRQRIINDWGKHLEFEYIAGRICDTTALPHAKEEILRAICEQILIEDDEGMLQILLAAAQPLADYQSGVGDVPLSLLGGDPSELFKLDPQEAANIIANNSGRERYKEFEPLVSRDLGRIISSVSAAKEQRNRHI